MGERGGEKKKRAILHLVRGTNDNGAKADVADEMEATDVRDNLLMLVGSGHDIIAIGPT